MESDKKPQRGIVKRMIELKEELAEQTFLREYEYLKRENPQHYQELYDEIVGKKKQFVS